MAIDVNSKYLNIIAGNKLSSGLKSKETDSKSFRKVFVGKLLPRLLKKGMF